MAQIRTDPCQEAFVSAQHPASAGLVRQHRARGKPLAHSGERGLVPSYRYDAATFVARLPPSFEGCALSLKQLAAYSLGADLQILRPANPFDWQHSQVIGTKEQRSKL